MPALLLLDDEGSSLAQTRHGPRRYPFGRESGSRVSQTEGVGSDWILTQREQELLRSAADDLPMLGLADDVSHLLVEVIEQVTVDASQQDRTADDLRRHALWFMAIITVRAMRSAMRVLAIGYEEQSVGYQRLIDELHNRAQQIHADESGDHARRWLDGKPVGKGAKLAGQGFWEFLSGPVHANVRAVLDWLAISQDDGTAKVVIGPERRSEVANAALTYMASEGRDIANLLALEVGLSLDLTEIDGRLHKAHDTYIPDTPGAGDES